MRTLAILFTLALSATASADFIRANVVYSDGPYHPEYSFHAVYDPSTGEVNRAYANLHFSASNSGAIGFDYDADGWVDPLTGDFDITLDAQCCWVQPTGWSDVYTSNVWRRLPFMDDTMRLHNVDGDTWIGLSYDIEGPQGPDQIHSKNFDVEFRDTVIAVPEPSSLLLLVIGCCIAMSRRYR